MNRTPAPVKTAAPVKRTSSSKPGIVSKADLDTYRKNVGNPNATLGQYMNDLKNKTAIKGGRNDPSVIQKRLDKTSPGQKAFDPTTSTGQYGGPKSTPAPKPAEAPTPSATPAPKPAETPAAAPAPTVRPDMPHKGSEWKSGMEPVAVPGGPSSASSSSSLPSMARPGGGASDSAEEGKKKMAAMNSLKEEVQVGDNKYRII